MKEILNIICTEGILSKGEIAEKMGIQESTLMDILSLLLSKGYLKTINSSKETPSVGCCGCSISKECHNEVSSGNIYLITKKGKNYLMEN